eukprot:TRINITY_DN1326_c0_g1_i9.p1 TRINITY_DN1326_c0_g1~~TRINITY_DN1326_c0_g1_i9.p1  ORF type:complete len:606 (-),score=92.54 TRINITY_DN1326_c0_g1_i9:640-2457(-)
MNSDNVMDVLRRIHHEGVCCDRSAVLQFNECHVYDEHVAQWVATGNTAMLQNLNHQLRCAAIVYGVKEDKSAACKFSIRGLTYGEAQDAENHINRLQMTKSFVPTEQTRVVRLLLPEELRDSTNSDRYYVVVMMLNPASIAVFTFVEGRRIVSRRLCGEASQPVDVGVLAALLGIAFDWSAGDLIQPFRELDCDAVRDFGQSFLLRGSKETVHQVLDDFEIAGRMAQAMLFSPVLQMQLTSFFDNTPHVADVRRPLCRSLMADYVKLVLALATTAEDLEGPAFPIPVAPFTETALVEALANAVCHGLWSSNAQRLCIDVYNRRLEISNPCNSGARAALTGCLSVEGKHPVVFNKLLHGVLQRCGLAQGCGIGQRNIIWECLKRGQPPATFRIKNEKGVYVWTTTLYHGKPNANIARFAADLTVSTYLVVPAIEIVLTVLLIWLVGLPVATIRKFAGRVLDAVLRSEDYCPVEVPKEGPLKGTIQLKDAFAHLRPELGDFRPERMFEHEIIVAYDQHGEQFSLPGPAVDSDAVDSDAAAVDSDAAAVDSDAAAVDSDERAGIALGSAWEAVTAVEAAVDRSEDQRRTQVEDLDAPADVKRVEHLEV